MNILRKIWRKICSIICYRLFPGITGFVQLFFTTRRSILHAHKNVHVGPRTYYLSRMIDMDEHSRVQNDVMIIAHTGKVRLKKFSAISARCLLIPGGHIPTVGLPQFLSVTHINDFATTIVIEEDCWVGADCTLLSKAHVGRGAVVGSSSLVTKEIPPYAVVAGSPTKIIAVRFSIDQIIEHERILYPKEERFTREYLEELFAKYYTNCKPIGTSKISDKDLDILKKERKKIGIEDWDA